MTSRYVNPFTDFGFKKLFGEESSKEHLINFLNCLLPPENQIIDLTFQNTEHWGLSEDIRKSFFDIYCTNNQGEKFIVELQRAQQNFFRDRSLYYATFAIQEQARKGNWDYSLKKVYCIGILDFVLQAIDSKYRVVSDKQRVVQNIYLKDDDNIIVHDKLQFIYIMIPNFNKVEAELTTQLDKWLYFLKHLASLEDIPTIFSETVFSSAFQVAEVSKYNKIEMNHYLASLKVYWDNDSVLSTAKQEGEAIGLQKGKELGIQEGEAIGLQKGKELGIQEGEAIGLQKGKELGIQEGKELGIQEGKLVTKIELVQKLKEEGIDPLLISKLTDFTLQEIEKL